MNFLILIFLWPLLLFGSHGPKCPSLQRETSPVWTEQTKVDVTKLDGKKITLECTKNACYNFTTATVTINSVGVEIVQTGTATDTAAVEHNKRVRECQTANGEF